ncbi:MAG: ABC transporter permease [Acidobacteriota bacterium]
MPVLETFVQDLKVGARVLRRERSFFLIAVFVLALGVAAVTAQFSVVNGIMLRGFSFPNAERLTDVTFVDPTSATFFGINQYVSAMDYEEFRTEQKSFEKLAAYLSGSTVNVTVNGTPQRYNGSYVTEDFLRILGLGPMLGRDLTAADNVTGAPKVALISYGIWQRDFGGAQDIVGKAVRINGAPATVIGVMPRRFNFPVNDDLWIPLYTEFPVRPRTDPRAFAPSVIGLIKPGVSAEQAQAEFTAFARRFAKAYPETNKAFTAAQVQPLIKTFTPLPLRGTLLTMLGFCVGVLLIACVNVMNMQFGRAMVRARELAVRSSLGATRTRVLRQMLTESVLLATTGAVLGIVLAYFALDWLSATLRNMDNPPPSWMTFEIDLPVLAITVAATVLAVIVSGLLPAWLAVRANAAAILREGGRGATSNRIGVLTRGLVVFQIVVTCVLLIGSLLQVRSLLKQQTIDYGYDTSGVLSARMGLMDADYPTPESRKLFYDRLLRELRATPEFEAVALTNRMRMVFSGNGPIEIEGKVYKDKRDHPNTNFEQISDGYFGVTGQKVIEGRAFNASDIESTQPIAIVNAAFARKHFGNDSAIGRRFRTGDGTGAYGPWRTVVGVVSTVRMIGPFNNPNVDESGFYVPYYSAPFGPLPDAPLANQFGTAAVRPHASQRAEALIPVLRQVVRKVDPNLPLYFVGTAQQHLDSAIAANRVIATMFSIFGIVAVVLAAAGIYGVMSFSVSRRTQEFGVRMALGAGYGAILRMVLAQGALQVGAGLAIGLGLAWLLATVGREAIGNTLFNVSARDPLTYGLVFLVVAVISLVAILVPGRRATRVDPLIALRAE